MSRPTILSLVVLAVAGLLFYLAFSGTPDDEKPEAETHAAPAPAPDTAAGRPALGAPDPVVEDKPVQPLPEGDEELLASFPSMDGDQRTAAMPRLGELARGGNATALSSLLKGLEDPEDQVREAAVIAIGNLRDPSLVPRLAPLVHDPEEDVREEVVKALAKMRSPEAGKVLTQMVRDRDEDVVWKAIQAIKSAGYKQAVPAVRDVSLGNDMKLAAKAAETLRALGEQAATDAALAHIAKGLESDSVITRRKTVRWLHEVGGESALVYLRQAYSDPDQAVRNDASRALDEVTEDLKQE